MTLERLPDWKPRLIAYLAAMSRVRFRPGRHDCALFCAGGVQAMTGVDLSKEWQGYRTLAEGRARLRQAGHADHVSLVASLLPEVPRLSARVGDVAAMAGDLGTALGLVQGEAIYVLRETGIGTVPLVTAERVFRV